MALLEAKEEQDDDRSRRRPASRPASPGPHALLVLLSLVILFVVVSVVLTFEGRARPVSVSQAISRYHSDPSADPGTHPPPGVYSYQGTGTDSLSLPPLSQAEGPTLPGTVEIKSRWVLELPH